MPPSPSPPPTRVRGLDWLEVPDAAWTAVLFRVLLGLVFVAAFGSLLPQIDGLIGSGGIAPAADLLSRARESLGSRAFTALPTLFWLGASDRSLHLLCLLGIAGGALLAAGIAPKPMLVFLWAAYLSFVSVGDVFLGYQWDALLLETAFFAFFVMPARLLPSRAPPSPPPRAGWWMLRVLLFKLMFLAGLVKLASGDPHWRDLTALEFHWWTQPLPAWTAWYASRLPDMAQRFAVLATFAIELAAPLMIFGPRPLRRAGFALLVLLQIAIAATGSYGFFNLLAIALCLAACDDDLLRGVVARVRRLSLPREPAMRDDAAASIGARRAIDVLVATAGMQLFLPLGVFFGFFPSLARDLPRPARAALASVQRLGTFNAYGLFAVMTTTRREIEVEGSDDGVHWRRYAFADKPGALDRRPAFVAPDMPRLDWQMWFAGLESCESDPWFLSFQKRLLEGSPAVLSLLASNPFPDAPPRYLRTPTWKYRFSEHGPDWWTRTDDEDFCPPVALDAGRLHVADLPR